MTNTTNGWRGKPGVPLNPEQSGWHWVSWEDEAPWALEWESPNWLAIGRGHWCFGGGQYGTEEEVGADGWTYLGPVMAHNEATALQARVAELEGALKDAAASVGEWGAYASQYLQEKWDLPGEVARYIVIAEGKKA